MWISPRSAESRVVSGLGDAGALSRSWTVAALVLAVSDALASRFPSCQVRGELAGVSRAPSGHCYFTLKDADGAAAALRCAMFRRAASLLDFAPRDGLQVEVRGRLAVYEPRGELQLVVEAMRPLGAGSLHERFLALKAKLEAEGLFDASRKRPLPAFPARIGVVSSLQAAALHDVLVCLARRAPQLEIVVYPSLVQGAEAPAALVSALQLAAERREVDTLILARGGGSLEDLWAFNDERVVRAVAASPIPVVCGVGHETDFTLAEFAADLRGATPTAAAELAAPSAQALQVQLQGLAAAMARGAERTLALRAQRLDRLLPRLGPPAARLAAQSRSLDGWAARLRAAAIRCAASRSRPLQGLSERWRALGASQFGSRRHRLDRLATALRALDPQRVVERGFAVAQTAAGDLVTDPAQLRPGDWLRLVLARGSTELHVDRTREPESD